MLLIAAVVAATAPAALVVTAAVVGVMMIMITVVASVVMAVAAMAAVVYPPINLRLPDLSCERLVSEWGFELLVAVAVAAALYRLIVSAILLANFWVVDYTQFPNVFL